MAKHEDRHIGKRENVWFPIDEHDKMLEAMSALKETNKSTFIRTAVRNLINALDERNKSKKGTK
jgi:hypothetical protein